MDRHTYLIAASSSRTLARYSHLTRRESRTRCSQARRMHEARSSCASTSWMDRYFEGRCQHSLKLTSDLLCARLYRSAQIVDQSHSRSTRWRRTTLDLKNCSYFNPRVIEDAFSFTS